MQMKIWVKRDSIKEGSTEPRQTPPESALSISEHSVYVLNVH